MKIESKIVSVAGAEEVGRKEVPARIGNDKSTSNKEGAKKSIDKVDQASQESFPASDAPGW